MNYFKIIQHNINQTINSKPTDFNESRIMQFLLIYRGHCLLLPLVVQ